MPEVDEKTVAGKAAGAHLQTKFVVGLNQVENLGIGWHVESASSDRFNLRFGSSDHPVVIGHFHPAVAAPFKGRCQRPLGVGVTTKKNLAFGLALARSYSLEESTPATEIEFFLQWRGIVARWPFCGIPVLTGAPRSYDHQLTASPSGRYADAEAHGRIRVRRLRISEGRHLVPRAV